MRKIDKYLKALKVLKTAQYSINEIYNLENILKHYERYYAVNYLSSILVKYKKEIDIISNLTNRGNVEISKSEPIEVYDEENISDEKIIQDIYYAIDCLTIIFAVKNKMADTIEEAINDISEL